MYAIGVEERVVKRFPLAGGKGVVVRPPQEKQDVSCEPHERPQGLVWLCSQSVSSSDAWMIENFDPEHAGESPD